VRGRGFTLLELMVVMVIIGLVSAGFILSLGATGRDSQMERERDRLVALIDYVRERAALQTVEYGLRCQQDGYQFVMYDTRKALWAEDPLDESLRPRTLPAGLAFELSVENKPIVLPVSGAPVGKSPDRHASAADLTPQVMLFSNGELTLFKLTLKRSGTARSALVNSAANGKIESGAVLEAPT
jgi:general secretion pathway protein H